MIHLRYQYDVAHLEHDETRHACDVMTELGITYRIAKGIAIGDQFWFLDCSNVPAELPPFITPLPDEAANLYL